MSYPVIILGAGGHAKVLINALQLQSVELLGITDTDSSKEGQLLMGIPMIGNDEEVMKFSAETVRLVNGLGSTYVSPHRRQLFDRFRNRGYQFAHVVHPFAIPAEDLILSEGAQIMAGAVVQPGCRIGKNVIINTHSTVDHDCHIGDHAHISPGATLSGGVCVEANSHIGAGATVIQGIRIGHNCLVAAGSVVIRNVPDGVAVVGVPAREMEVES